MASGVGTHTYTHTYFESDFKKPGAPACGRHVPGLKIQYMHNYWGCLGDKCRRYTGIIIIDTGMH